MQLLNNMRNRFFLHTIITRDRLSQSFRVGKASWDEMERTRKVKLGQLRQYIVERKHSKSIELCIDDLK